MSISSGDPKRKKWYHALFALAAVRAVLGSPELCHAQPAPPISAVGVYAVHSANEPNWVYPYSGQYSTYGEGGAWVVVCTYEQGYGTPQSATINGVPGTQMTQLLTPRVINGVIVGYWRYWLFQNKNNNGEFVYTVRSINGGSTKTTWIYIE